MVLIAITHIYLSLRTITDNYFMQNIIFSVAVLFTILISSCNSESASKNGVKTDKTIFVARTELVEGNFIYKSVKLGKMPSQQKK